jgi:flagellar protein FliL
MAEETEKHVEEGAAPKRKKPLVLVLILAASIVVGGAVGVFVAVPLLVGNPPAAMASGEVAEDSVASPSRSSRGSRDAPPILFTIDNMVLNPRGTGGSRFLMVTTAFEVSDTRVLEQMRLRELEIRDHLLRTYGARTVEDLADLEQRDALREQVRTAIELLLHRGAIERVYLPQFVIQ